MGAYIKKMRGCLHVKPRILAKFCCCGTVNMAVLDTHQSHLCSHIIYADSDKRYTNKGQLLTPKENIDPQPQLLISGIEDDTLSNDISDWKSGPVSVFDLQGLRPRPRLVHQSPNTSKNQTGPIKDHKKPIKTGLDQLLVLTGLNWFKTSLLLNIRHIFISNVCWG